MSIACLIISCLNGKVAYDLFKIENQTTSIKFLAWGNLVFSAANMAFFMLNV